jgi:fucose permease
MTDAGRDEYRGLQFSIFAGAFVLGIAVSALGSLLPALFPVIGYKKADAGGLFLAMNLAMLIGSVLFGPVCDRFGFRILLLSSTLLVAGSFALIGLAAAYRELLRALLVLGLGGGALNGAVNALLNDISSEGRQRALNLLGLYFGCGALFTPFAIGSALETLGLRTILAGLLLLSLAPFILFLRADFPAPKHGGGFSRTELKALFRNPLLFLFGGLLFFQSGNEFTIGGWLSTYLGESSHMSPRGSAYALAGYWTAFMLGRLAASRWAEKLSTLALVTGSSALGCIAVTGLILVPEQPVASFWVILIGLGFAAIFPTTLAEAGAVFAQYSGTAFGAIFVMALCGGMTAPWVVGRIAQGQSVGTGFWITALSCAAIAALQAVICLRARASNRLGQRADSRGR